MICEKCKSEFPQAVIINGKRKYLHQRRFCPTCSPLDKKNTKDLIKYPPARTIDGILHKTCRGCKKELPYIEEYFYIKSSWGKRRALCKICSRKSKNNRNNEQKQWAVNLLGGKCCLCGYNKCLAALDFHHTDPSKKDFTIASKKKQSDLEKELKKCILVCRNCHAEIHCGKIREPIRDEFVSLNPIGNHRHNPFTGETMYSGIFQQSGSIGQPATITFKNGAV